MSKKVTTCNYCPPAIVRICCAALLLLNFSSCLGEATPSNVSGTGRAELVLESVEWGRLVDVLDANGKLVKQDVLIRESLQDQTGRYTLGVNPITQSELLSIHEAEGDPQFAVLLQAAQTGRTAIIGKGFSEPGPFSMVARNGAIRLQFSELIDPSSVTRDTIQLAVGEQAASSQQVRYVVDNSTFDIDGNPKGVVILDTTVSATDSASLGIQQNGIGLPASYTTDQANVAIRIPTQIDPIEGQFEVLRNLSGNHSIAPTSSDPLELSQLGQHPIIVRALRSGNSDDPYNGFLLDNLNPYLVGEFDSNIWTLNAVGGGSEEFMLKYSIKAQFCRAIHPKLGDVFSLGELILQVVKIEDASSPSAYQVHVVKVSGLADVPVGDFSSSPLAAQLTSKYTSQDSDLQLCYLRFDPEPEFGLPARGIDPASTISVRFSEAINIQSVRSMESMVCISYIDSPAPANSNSSQEAIDDWAARQFNYPRAETVGEYIDRQLGYQQSGSGSGRLKFGSIVASLDAHEFTLASSFGLSDSHGDGNNLHLALALRTDAKGIVDLAGNRLNAADFVAGTIGQSELITPGSVSPWPSNRYFALRFNSTDENNDGRSEYVGQFDFTSPGEMRGRPVSRYSRLADSSNVYVNEHFQLDYAVLTPLTPAGAVLQTCWPYHTLGFGLMSPSELNIDVEGMNWSPFSGVVYDDNFEHYSIALSHSERTPDTLINTGSGYPQYPNSGLQRFKEFDENVLGWKAEDSEFDEVVVADGTYNISANSAFLASSGNKMVPWMEFERSYTWRDNAIPQYESLDGGGYLGGKAGGSLNPEVTGLPEVWGPGKHRSIGVPLLARFRCYPEGEKFGANGFQVQLMCGSKPLPAFRVFSAGGVDSSGTWNQVIPDDPGSNGTFPSGGYHGTTGVKTAGYGPELYWQQIDFVVRVSRVYTHWFSFGGRPESLSEITMEPRPEDQPTGTKVVLDFRGCNTIDTTGCENSNALNDANSLDLYGDVDLLGHGCGSISTPTGWKENMTHLLDHQSGQEFNYFQARLSFVSNVELELEPMLGGMGFAWNVE